MCQVKGSVKSKTVKEINFNSEQIQMETIL